MPHCAVEGCSAKHYGKGYCRPHYRWFIESGHTEPPRATCEECDGAITDKRQHSRFCSAPCQMRWHRKRGCYTEHAKQSRAQCAIEGCKRPVEAKGYCNTHRIRLLRHGDPQAYFAKRVTGECEVAGCERPPVCKQLCEKHYIKKYIAEHRLEWNARHSARRSRLRQATPAWADMNEIRKVYRLCAQVTAQTGVEHHVDHAIPIKGRGACGLHVHWNLQILPGTDNRKKSNKM